jgi:tRNA pseudouridine55 synthase
LWRKEDEFCIDVLCSKGTYIRSLVDDIGRFLGCGAVLTDLRRTKTAQFEITECATLEQIEQEPQKYLLSAERAVDYLQRVEISENQAKRFLNGAALDISRVKLVEPPLSSELFRVINQNEFLGLAEYNDQAKELSVKFITKD